MTLDFFKQQRVMCPELCFLTSIAVGFPVLVYRKNLSNFDPSIKGDKYQIMRWDESPGPGREFWESYLWEKLQWFDTPEAAAAAFVQGWLEWQRQQSGREGLG